MSAWLLLGPQRGQIINLSRVISAQAQVDVFLINEAYVIYCETIEEYPSHSSDLCHRGNYEVTFLKQGRPGVQALPDNCFSETQTRGQTMENSKT